MQIYPRVETDEDRARERRHERDFQKRKNRALARMSRPCLDDEKMDSETPLGCSKADFKRPRLRQCPFELTTMKFVGRLGGGLDGYTWKIQAPKGGPTYALKLFWDTEPWFPQYFAPQRESQNAAWFQLIETAVLDASGPDNGQGPILLYPDPKTEDEAIANLRAFSNEARQHQREKNIDVPSSGLLQIIKDDIPRLRKCYGWLKFTGEALGCRLPFKLRPPYIKIDKVVRRLEDEKLYTAIVYEYIENVENDHEVAKSAMDFFWLVGFSQNQTPAERNWKDSVLVDLSDIAGPGAYGWRRQEYHKCDQKTVLEVDDEQIYPPQQSVPKKK